MVGLKRMIKTFWQMINILASVLQNKAWKELQKIREKERRR